MKAGNYKVRWYYDSCEKELHNQTTTQNCTSCIIDEFTGNTEEPFREIVKVTIKKYHKDIFNKSVARKTSFKLAIAGFPKNVRAMFWDEFKKTVKIH